MNTYDIQFYDLLSRAGISNGRQLQGFIDNVVMQKYNDLSIEGFTFAPEMQLEFTYEQVQKELGLNPMAAYVDLDSETVPDGKQGATIHRGTIPRMKKVELYNEDKFRKMLITEQRFGANSDRAMNAAVRDLFITTDNLVGGHVNSLSYQRHQLVSTGKFTITPENNPNGSLHGVTFASHVPTANVKKLSGQARLWTDAERTVEGTASDIIKELVEIVDIARRAGVRGHFEVNYNYLTRVLNHSAVAKKIGINALPASVPEVQISFVSTFSRDRKKSAFEELVGASIVEREHLVATQVYNRSTKAMKNKVVDAFEENVFVFVPDGNIGEVITVEPITVGGGTYANFLGGRGLLTVGVDPVKKCQGFYTEMTSLLVPTMPQNMYYLYPNNA